MVEAKVRTLSVDDIKVPFDIFQEIRDFVSAYQEAHHTKTGWREPIIGVAQADNPRFATLKEIVTPTHATPEELVPGAKSVVVYFVPFAENVVTSNIPGEESSQEWMDAYADTNDMLSDLSQHLHDLLVDAGYDASNLPPTYNYDAENLCSDWSHRSAAYIAGVGTFGVHHMLITQAGCCGRIGSVVTTLELEPTPMLEEELCSFKRNGSCGVCTKRCPANALSVANGIESYDKYACNSQIYEKVYPRRQVPGGDSCGKCMVGVPCAMKAPRV